MPLLWSGLLEGGREKLILVAPYDDIADGAGYVSVAAGVSPEAMAYATLGEYS